MTEATKITDKYIVGDDAAAREEKLPLSVMRKLRTGGKLKGAVATVGHRTIIYHRDRLKRRVAEAFEG
jgi:hypothetical protein